MKRSNCLLNLCIILSVVLVLAGDTTAPQVFGATKLKGPLKGKSMRVLYVKNKKGKKIEYGSASKLKSKGYSIFQGACTDGEYSYLVLFNKRKNRCRLIKVDPKSNKVLKHSPSYKIYHGNDMAYDSKRDRIVVVHGDGDTKRLSVFDPKTLKKKRTFKLSLRSSFKGASTSAARSLKGVTGIAYDRKKDRFICSVKDTFHYVILSAKFKPIKMVRTKTNSSRLQKQGMEIYGRYILRVMNIYKGKSIVSYIYIYRMNGKFVKRVKIKTGSEPEAVYILNDRLYIPTYVEKVTSRSFRNWSYILKSSKKI